MSGEDEKKVQEIFIDKLGAKYPFVTVDKAKMGAYGIKFYPSIYCIDADGNVHSVPDDRMPSESTIEDLLKSATLAPGLPDESQYGALRSMWDKKDYAKVRDYLTKMLGQDNLDADMRKVFEEQQGALGKKVERQEKAVENLAKGPDYFAAQERLGKIAKDWKGFDVADKAKAELDRFKGDSDIKKEISASKALAKVIDKFDPSNANQMRKLMGELRKFADSKKYAGTHAAETAQKKLGDG